MFQDSDDSRVERGITVNVLVLAEAVGTLLGKDSTTINAIRDNTRCIEMDTKATLRADHHTITILVPDMNVAQEAENFTRNVVRAHSEGNLEYMKRLEQNLS